METLFFYPTPKDDPIVCNGLDGSLTDSAWNELCQVALLPDIRGIVATWAE